MKTGKTRQDVNKQNSSLYRILNEVFSPETGAELLSEIDRGRGDLNHRVISSSGYVYMHPPLYYATLAANGAAIKHLQASGAQYSQLTHEERDQIRNVLLRELDFLANPKKQLDILMHSNPEIDVHVPKSALGVLPEQVRQVEIEKRQKVLDHFKKSYEGEIHVVKGSNISQRKKEPSKKPIIALGSKKMNVGRISF